jgi:hypothetical protein
MLVIRKEQMESFGSYIEKNFLKRMAIKLRSDFKDLASSMTDEQLCDWVQQSIEKARSYAIEDIPDVERFIELAAAHGIDFDSEQTVSSILNNLEYDSLDKIDKVHFFFQMNPSPENENPTTPK